MHTLMKSLMIKNNSKVMSFYKKWRCWQGQTGKLIPAAG